MTQYYTNLNIHNKRQQLQSQLDHFATFTWNGIDMFDQFGAFIINEKKGGLKFYNGPSFTNQYSKPQFQEGMNNLLGINTNIQVIDFTIGIYYFTIDEYRELLKLFDPYEIGDLSFSFNPEWRYRAKIKNRSDSTRFILDKFQDQYYYYTEWKLSFELQGGNYLLAVKPYTWEKKLQLSTKNTYNYWQIQAINNDQPLKDNYHEQDTIIRTPLDCSLDIYWSIPISLLKDKEWNFGLWVQVPACGAKASQFISLVNCLLEPLPITPLNGTYLNVHYLSEQGLLLWSIDNNTEELLTLRTSSADGTRLVRSIEINKFMLPSNQDLTQYKLIFSPFDLNNDQSIINIESYARTNII